MSDAYEKDADNGNGTIDYGINKKDMRINAFIVPVSNKKTDEYDNYVVVRKNHVVQVIGMLHGHLHEHKSYDPIKKRIYLSVKNDKVNDSVRPNLEELIKRVYGFSEKVVYRI
jgi:hypothetical protein